MNTPNILPVTFPLLYAILEKLNQLTLTIAYMNVKRYDLAEQSLRQAKTLDPEASEFQYLREKVNARAKYRHI